MTTKLDGESRRWQLRKRYGYFEKVVAVRAAAAAAACSMTPPALPGKRKIFGHKNPRYVASLRSDLEAYMRRVVELLQALTCGRDELPPDAETLEHLLGLLDLVAPQAHRLGDDESRASAREAHDAAAERLWNRTLHDATEARRLLQGVGPAAGSAPRHGADAWANAGWDEEECGLLLEAGLVVQWVEAGELVIVLALVFQVCMPVYAARLLCCITLERACSLLCVVSAFWRRERVLRVAGRRCDCGSAGLWAWSV